MIDKPAEQESKGGKARANTRRPAAAERRDDIAKIITRFTREIDSLADTLPLAMLAIAGAQRSAFTKLDQFVAEHGSNRDEERHTVEIKADDRLRYEALVRKHEMAFAAEQLVPRSFVVALVSQYDAFLGQLIQALLLLKPEILGGSEKTVTLAELLAFGSVESVRDHILEKEVESVLRRSHSEQFEWLENKFGLPLRKNLPAWSTFVELTERRNLFVHTGGVVSQQYLSVCKAHGVDCSKTARGKRLSVSPGYFAAAHSSIYEIGVKLAHVLWRKLRPDQRLFADESLTSLTYDLLTEGRNVQAIVLLDFATEVLKEHSSAEHKLRFLVNRAQAYKWNGDQKKVEQILAAQDFSALNDTFRLAHAVLLDRYTDAVSLVRRIGATGDLTANSYRDWPLFRELRKQPEFEEAFRDVFGEPLQPLSVSSPTPAIRQTDPHEASDDGQAIEKVPDDERT